MKPLEGKTALITGGSRGIGAATAARLAADGARVAVNYAASEGRAASVVDAIKDAGGDAFAVRADVTDDDAVAAMFHTLGAEFAGGLDILFNNAGLYDVVPVGEADLAHYDRTLSLNVRAVIAVTLAAEPMLNDGGRVITTGSVLGERVPFPAHSAYAMSKAAVVGLTKGLARDFGPRGITVNCVQPGPIDTEMNPDSEENPGADMQRQMTAPGRFGKADEVAAAVAYLCRPEAAFVTGGTLNVDGGIFC